MRFGRLLPRSFTAWMCIFMHVAALVLGWMAFRHEEGAYFVVFPERLLMGMGLGVCLCIGLGVAAIQALKLKQLVAAFIALVCCCVTSHLLYTGLEMWAFRVMGYKT